MSSKNKIFDSIVVITILAVLASIAFISIGNVKAGDINYNNLQIKDKVYILGTYVPRTSSDQNNIAGMINSNHKRIILQKKEDIGKFKIGDIITTQNSLQNAEIVDISSDGRTITYEPVVLVGNTWTKSGAINYFTGSNSEVKSIYLGFHNGLNYIGFAETSGLINQNCLPGGSNSECISPTNGLCGSANGSGYISTPSVNLCSKGTSSIVINNGAGNIYSWTCSGSGGGENASCSASNNNIPPPFPSCTATGQVQAASQTYPGVAVTGVQPAHPACDIPNKIVCTGVGIGYEMSSCNVGSSISGTGLTSYGLYFQWGRNKGFVYGDTSKQSTIIDGTVGLNASTDTYGFMWNASPRPDSWANTNINNNWGNTTNTSSARQGPCATGYRVPTNLEWYNIVIAGGWGLNGADMRTKLNLPFAGYRSRETGAMTNYASNVGNYWSSSPVSTIAFSISIFSTQIYNSQAIPHSFGYPIRCFKN